MAAFLLRCFDLFARRPFALLGGLAALLALAVVGAAQMRISEDILALLPADEPVVAQSRSALRHFKRLERIVIGLEGENIQSIARDVDEAESRLVKLEGVRTVVGHVRADAQDDILTTYSGKAPLLFDEPMRAAVQARLTRAEFQKRLQGLLDRQAGAEGIAVGDNFRADPFGLDELVFRRFEQLNSGYDARLVGGRLFSKDGRMALLFVETDHDGTDTLRGRDFQPLLDEALAGLPGGSRAHVVGVHRASVENANVLRRDLHWTIAASAIAVMLLFFIAFRSLVPVLLAVTSAGFGFAAALGLQGWMSAELSAIAAGFAGVLMAISLDCAIHLVSAFSSMEGERADRARRALAHVAMPSSLAVLTTIVAVATLWLSSFDGLHQLCEMGIAGMLGALAFSLVAGPQALRKFGPAPRPHNPLGALLGGAESLRRRLRGPILWLAALISLGAASCLPLVQFDGDVSNLDGKSATTRDSEARIDQAFGAAGGSRTLVVSGGDSLQAALRETDLAAIELGALGAKFESPAHVVPALETQRENLARWRDFFDAARIEHVRAAMVAARATRPDTGALFRIDEAALEAKFAGFFAALRLEQQPGLLDPAAMAGRPVWALVSNYISESDGRFYVGATAQLDEAQIVRMQEQAGPQTSVVNKRAFVARIVSLIQRDLGLMGGLSLALVVALVGLTFRQLRETLIALVPVMGALLWTLGLMGGLDIPFNIINTLVAVFVAGLGIDYGIFFVQTWRECGDTEEAARRLRVAGTGVLLAALVNLAGFGTLALAGHPALFSVGITTVFGILASLGLTLFIVPTLLEIGKAR